MPSAARSLALAAVLLLDGRAFAADSPGETSAVQELAREMVPLETHDAMSRMSAKMFADQLAQDARKRGGTVDPDFEAKVLAAYSGVFTYEDRLKIQVALLTRNFTEAEIREIAAFYRTPTGRKSMRILPELARQTMASLKAFFDPKVPRLKAELEPYLNLPRRATSP